MMVMCKPKSSSHRSGAGWLAAVVMLCLVAACQEKVAEFKEKSDQQFAAAKSAVEKEQQALTRAEGEVNAELFPVVEDFATEEAQRVNKDNYASLLSELESEIDQDVAQEQK